MAEGAAVTGLKIIWAEWAPADYLQQIGDLYAQEKGIQVTVIQEPWGSFADLFFARMAAHDDAWDMVVGDSQWLGQSATEGYYVELTDFLVSSGIADTVTDATRTYYAEYPTGSGVYWAYPTEGDATGWAYRKDLFETPAEKAAFQAQYGYPLAVPQTYEQLRDIAKFFNRPTQGLNGLAIYTQKDYDAITMGVENLLFSWGGRWQAPDNTVLGVVNSPDAVEAVAFYKELYDCCQAPGLTNAFFVETNQAYIEGKTAMVMNYFAFFPDLANPATNPRAAVTGYFPNPAGPTGERHAALGGQGLSIISFISDERKEASKEFIRWFAQESVQAKWAAFGGYTCNANVLASPAFMDAIAQEHDRILRDAGFITDGFIRGDANADTRVNIADPVRILGHLFLHQEIDCQKADDANADGALDIADPIFLLDYLFRHGSAPDSPFPYCGMHRALDLLTCQSFPPCRRR